MKQSSHTPNGISQSVISPGASSQSVISPELSRLITTVRVPMMVGIVMIHCNYLVMVDEPAHITPLASTIIRFLSEGLPMVCVPFFFFLSGMLFFNRLSSTTLWPKMRRRARTLLVPYLIWCTVGLCAFAIKLLPPLAARYPDYADLRFTWLEVLKGYWVFNLIDPESIGPYDYVMWFVRDLIVVITLSPLLMWLVKGWRILVIIVGYFAAYYSGLDSLGMGAAILFFCLGGWAVGLKRSRLEGALTGAWWTMPIYLAYSVAHIITPESWIESEPVWLLMMAIGIAGVFWATAWARRLTGWTPRRFVNESLFFVFAFHGIFAYVATRQLVCLMAPATTVGALFCYFTLVAVHWCVALSVFAILRRFWPRLTAVITGGRAVNQN